MATITTDFLEMLSVQELYLLKAKVDIVLREKRVREVFNHKEDNKNPLVQSYFALMEIELSKNFPSCSKINDLLDMLEFVLKIDLE